MFKDLIKKQRKYFNAISICPGCGDKWYIEFSGFNCEKEIYDNYKDVCFCGKFFVLKDLSEDRIFKGKYLNRGYEWVKQLKK